MMVEADRALLRRFEPIIRYTRGEEFFPMDVALYVQNCSLWVQYPRREPMCLIPQGELTLERLAEPRDGGFGAVYFLKFIEPLNLAELAAYKLREGLAPRDPENVFHAGPGRLARVGYGSRFIDAFFSLTLLARGRVPGDTAAAAALAYNQILEESEHHRYYGRVIRRNGWVVVQYWFFYPFNNWRSGFYGVNDHEADWETVNIYLYESESGELEPEWVAYAAHDFYGDDLRRRWDDPELEKVGYHPVIYSGAGSHASYYAPGEYLAELEMPFLSPFVRLADGLQAFWRHVLRHVEDEEDKSDFQHQGLVKVFRVPFVDYARGDGISIGPGQEKEWDEPCLLEPPPAWAVNYRGLWGLYTRDPIAGEDAPAGPLYNRNGTERRSWYDPLGWAGLDKVPPPNEALAHTLEQQAKLMAQQVADKDAIVARSRELTGLGVEAAAMAGRPHLRKLYQTYQVQIDTLSKELNELQAQVASRAALLAAIDLRVAKLQAGERRPARAHIRRAHHPASPARLRFSRVAEAWAAVSIGLMMLGFVGVVLFAREYLVFGLAALLSVLIFIEAGFRRQLSRLIPSITIGLAIASAFILLFEFFWTIVIAGVLLAGSYIMWQNLRELWA